MATIGLSVTLRISPALPAHSNVAARVKRNQSRLPLDERVIRYAVTLMVWIVLT